MTPSRGSGRSAAGASGPGRSAPLAVILSRAAGLALAGALAGGLAACSASPDQTGTLAQRTRAWASGTAFGQDAGSLEADVARIDRDRRVAAPKVVEFNCYTLGQDAMKANGSLVTPDPTLSGELSRAYDDFYAFATSCVKAGGAPAALDRIAHRLDQGSRELAQAQARFGAITGR